MAQEVIFKLNHEDYGINIMHVNEIIRKQEITPMPNTRSYVMGVTNIRGKVIPVICLKDMLGIPEQQEDENTRIIVINYGEKTVGLMVDAVSEIIKVEEDQVETQEMVGVQEGKNCVLGVAKLERGLVKLLDVEKILTEK